MSMILLILFLPLIGTSIGALFVYFVRLIHNDNYIKITTGLAGGVMLASAIFSLLIPAINLSLFKGIIGFILGFLGFMIIDKLYVRKRDLSTLNLAVIIHNIPEGLIIGLAIFQAVNNNGFTLASAFILSMGIAVQNIPEGSIISLNMYPDKSKNISFFMGFLSGVIEPIASIIAVVLASFVENLLPYLLGFAAGNMIYVVVDDLMVEGHGIKCSIGFCIGFSLMLILDVVMG